MKPFIDKIVYLKELLYMLENNLNEIYINNTNIWSNTGWSINSETTDSERFSFEIYNVIEGTANLKIGDQAIAVSAGDVLFVDNSVNNSCKNGKFTIFGFNYSINQQNTDNILLYKQFRDCYRNLSGENFNVYKNLLKTHYMEIVKEYIVKPDEYQLNIKLLVLLIIVRILRSFKYPYKVDNQYRYFKYSSMVSEIILYISENMQRDIKLDELGMKYDFSTRYLNRIFKGVTGYPILQYLQQLKVEKAKKLLKSSKLSVLDIALELNFGSSQYLSSIFKKITGHTPVEFRKMK